MQTTDEPTRHGLSEDEARDLTDRTLRLSEAESVRVSVDSGRRAFVRCADNRITTAGGSTDVTVTIASAFGKKVASSTTNRLDDRALTEAVRKSEALARLAPENPEYMDELGEQMALFLVQRQHADVRLGVL